MICGVAPDSRYCLSYRDDSNNNNNNNNNHDNNIFYLCANWDLNVLSYKILDGNEHVYVRALGPGMSVVSEAMQPLTVGNSHCYGEANWL